MVDYPPNWVQPTMRLLKPNVGHTWGRNSRSYCKFMEGGQRQSLLWRVHSVGSTNTVVAASASVLSVLRRPGIHGLQPR